MRRPWYFIGNVGIIAVFLITTICIVDVEVNEHDENCPKTPQRRHNAESKWYGYLSTEMMNKVTKTSSANFLNKEAQLNPLVI